MAEHQYFEELQARIAPDLPRGFERAKQAILQHGVWEESEEWRMGTVTTSRIRPVVVDGEAMFRVTVDCDFEFACNCPTLERAVFFATLYWSLLANMFYVFSWPSFADKGRLLPMESEMTPGHIPS